jgi:NADH-quinone oxidoreductase subunit M
MFRRVMFGPVENEENRKLIDLDWREKTVLIAMVVPIVWIGVYPHTFLRRIEPSVIELLETMRPAVAEAPRESPDSAETPDSTSTAWLAPDPQRLEVAQP